jgi:hypothetical protein
MSLIMEERMKSKIAFVLAAMVPAIAGAQSATATATSQTTAKADIPASYSAESQTKINATFERARERKLPERPIRDRVAEGQAKAASEAQIVVAAQRAEARLEAAQSAMVRAGRQPNDQELIRAEAAMARGATEAQIEAAARSVQPDQQLIVQLDAIAAGSNATANANVGAAIAIPTVGATAGVTGAAAATTGAATGVTGAATAGVGAVIKKPPMI